MLFAISVFKHLIINTDMKILLIITLAIFTLFTVYFFIIGHNSKSKDASGLIEGHLPKCPDTPNCYNSELPEHTGHYISPITISANTPDALRIIKDIVINMGGVIKTENYNFFSATFTSSIFGFVDDLELRKDTNNNLIHIRSASRVGRSDLGVNKKRILLIKKLYKNKLTETRPSL